MKSFAPLFFSFLTERAGRCLVRALQLDEGAGLIAAQAPAKAYPVTRVVNLLKDMKEQLEKEQEADEEVYEKLACWCETNDKAKTKAIADAEAKLSQLANTIEKTLALKNTLEVEIEGLGKEIATNQKALDEATAIRTKQLAEFTAEEKEVLQSITALDSAITVLGKHHGAAALLDDGHGSQSAATAAVAAELKSAAAVAAKVLRRHSSVFRGVVTPHQRRLVAAFAQQVPQYQAQSGEIFGILRQMKETFTNNLSESQKEELEAQAAYKELKAAKLEEISTGQAALDDKTQHHAGAEEKLANARDEKEDTTASLGVDEKFLMDLKQRCSLTDAEWEDRQKTRQRELAAVAEAISILSNDDSRDLFSKTFNAASAAALLQRTASLKRSRNRDRSRAAAVLKAAALRANNPRLAALATSARLDAFTQVKQTIDSMVAELLKEAGDETKHRDFCIDEMSKNERTTASKVHEKGAVESTIETLKISIGELNATINALKSEISDLQIQKQRATEDRDLEHKAFQGTIADQKETQSLLQQALDVLQSVYKNTKAPELVQQKHYAATKGPPPPEGFKEYQQNKGSQGVVSLIMHIMEDAKAMEAETLHAEQQALADYEDFVQETTASVEAKKQSIVGRTSELAQGQQDLLEAKSDHDGVITELEGLSNDLAGLHGECDFFLKNFEVRTQARDEEVEALRQAKAYLNGMAL